MLRLTLSDVCQKARTVVVLVVCLSRRRELGWLHHIDIDDRLVQEAFGARKMNMEEYVKFYKYTSDPFHIIPCERIATCATPCDARGGFKQSHCHHHQRPPWRHQYRDAQHVHLRDLDHLKTVEPAYLVLDLYSALREFTNGSPICIKHGIDSTSWTQQ
jgi:hypothetical protein